MANSAGSHEDWARQFADPFAYPAVSSNPVVAATSFLFYTYLARRGGLEPPTVGLEIRCSVRLSYRR